MNDEGIIELYRSLLAAVNEEKRILYAQIKALIEEVSMLRQSMVQSKQAIDNLLFEIKSLCKKLEEKDNRIADLELQLYDAHELAKLGWKNMKPIKLNLKVCQNIGSETAAENAPIMSILDGKLQTEQIEGKTLIWRLFSIV